MAEYIKEKYVKEKYVKFEWWGLLIEGF